LLQFKAISTKTKLFHRYLIRYSFNLEYVINLRIFAYCAHSIDQYFTHDFANLGLTRMPSRLVQSSDPIHLASHCLKALDITSLDQHPKLKAALLEVHHANKLSIGLP